MKDDGGGLSASGDYGKARGIEEMTCNVVGGVWRERRRCSDADAR